MKVKMCIETMEQEGFSINHKGVPIYGTDEYIERDVSPLLRYVLDGKRIHQLLMSALLVHFKRELKKNRPTAEIRYTYAGPLYDLHKDGEYINMYAIIEYALSDSEDYQDFGFCYRQHVWFEVRA